MTVGSNPGCQTCKLRRIKCDSTLPTCQKCVKSKRICLPTSTAKQPIVVHLENQFASGDIKRPRGPRSSYVRPATSPDLATRAVAYYLQYHLHISDDEQNVAGGWSKCISKWRASGKSDEMVDLGLSTLALAVYSKLQHDPVAATMSSTQYSILLQMLQNVLCLKAVSSLDEDGIDACLLTIFLMGRYESAKHGCGSQEPAKTLPTWSHHDGAMAVLRLWYDKFRLTTDSAIVRMNRRGCLKSHLLRHKALPGFLWDGEQFGETGLELAYDRIYVRIIQVHVAVVALEAVSNPSVGCVEELDREIQEIVPILYAWRDQFSDGSKYEKVQIDADGKWPRTHFYTPTLYVHSDLIQAGRWAQYFSTMLLLMHTCWRLMKLLRTDTGWHDDMLKRATCFEDWVDGLAATIPYCLDRVEVVEQNGAKTYKTTKKELQLHLIGMVAWPLSIASSLEGIDSSKRKWFREELAELGRLSGDGGLEAAGSGVSFRL